MVINSPPISVTAHKGILSQNPQFSIADTKSSGNTVSVADETPAAVIIEAIPLCTIPNKVVINSIPCVMTAFAKMNRTKSFTACSGFFKSVKLPHVLTTPITKNRTNKPVPRACIAVLTLVIAVQIPPPLKFCGEVRIRFHNSVTLAFQVSSAFCRLPTTQLSDI